MHPFPVFTIITKFTLVFYPCVFNFGDQSQHNMKSCLVRSNACQWVFIWNQIFKASSSAPVDPPAEVTWSENVMTWGFLYSWKTAHTVMPCEYSISILKYLNKRLEYFFLHAGLSQICQYYFEGWISHFLWCSLWTAWRCSSPPALKTSCGCHVHCKRFQVHATLIYHFTHLQKHRKKKRKMPKIERR